MSACECDYDVQGDPLQYVKVSRFCPLHDDCEWCMERLGSIRTEGREWICAECNTDALAEAKR